MDALLCKGGVSGYWNLYIYTAEQILRSALNIVLMTRFEMCDDTDVYRYNYKWRFVVKSIKVFDIFGRSNL